MKINMMQEYIKTLNDDLNVLKTQEKKIKNISKLIKKSRNVFICGNGGSAATASHMVNDFQKMCGLKTFCLTDNTSLVTAWANDTDYSKIFMKQLEILAKRGDSLIIFSGSGESSNILRAAAWALDNHMKVICIIGNENAKILQFEGIHSIVIPTDMQHTEDLHLIIGHILAKMIGYKDG